MTAATARKPAAAPAAFIEECRNIEKIAGITLMSPRPAPRYSCAAVGLLIALLPAFDDHQRSRKSGRPARGPGGWQLLRETELHLRRNILIPDLAAWHTARLPVLPKTAYIALAPDWVCEVLSPSTETIDRFTKMPSYAAAGVPSVWLVDVSKLTVEVFRLTRGAYELVATHSGDKRVRIEPFAELPLDLATLWP